MKLLDDVKTRRFFIPIIILFLVGVDQIAKHIVSQTVKQEISLGFGGFGIKYITHQVFGINSYHIGVNDPGMVMNSIMLSVVLLCIYVTYRFLRLHFPQRKLFHWAFIFSFGGLFSNFIDGIILGHARDFIVFWKLGITNFADIFYYFGLALFILGFIIIPKIRKKLNPLSKQPLSQELADIKTFFQFSIDELKKLITLPIKKIAKIAKIWGAK